MNGSIHPATRMGAVGLIVSDLNRSVRYYHESIGLHVHRRSETQAWLGAGAHDLLVLTEQAGARPVQRGRTGLYHFAILVPSRKELARVLRHLIDTRTPLQGMSDHGVSEAIYLGDPDGHGIEIYRDRPRDEWPVVDETLQMTLDPLDVPGLLGEVTSGKVVWHGMHAETTIGHVHLHVASLSQAEEFYCGQLGFGFMQRMFDQASFVAAGGYHHHLGLNIWAGLGAPPPPADAARLDWFEIVLPTSAAYSEALARLRTPGRAIQEEAGRAHLLDPAQNPLVLVDGEIAHPIEAGAVAPLPPA
ncbi:MAG: VOC family protein [Caldilineaceae bacterium]